MDLIGAWIADNSWLLTPRYWQVVDALAREQLGAALHEPGQQLVTAGRLPMCGDAQAAKGRPQACKQSHDFPFKRNFFVIKSRKAKP